MVREIKPVKNNEDKCKTYRALKGKLSRSLREGFYLEAILLDYALMEDRLRSFIYYMGVLSDRTQTAIYKEVKPDIVAITEETNLKLNTISGKMKIVRSVSKWSSEVSHVDDTGYLIALNRVYENIDIQYFQELLDQIETWTKYRNEVIHSIMNKNLESLDERLEDKALEGKKLAEALDNQLKQFKKGNYARKFLKLPT